MSDLVYFLKFLFKLIRYRLFLWLIMIAGAALFEGLGISLFLPLLEGSTGESQFTRYTGEIFELFNLEPTFSVLLLVMVGFFFARSGLLIFQAMYVYRIVTRILVRLKCELVGKLFKADYQYFLRKPTGYITNAVTREMDGVASAFEKCMNFVVAVVFAILYVSLPLAMNPVVTAVATAIAIPTYFVLRRANKLNHKYSMEASAINANLQSYVMQAFHHLKYLKATHSSAGILGRVYETTEQQGDNLYKQNVLSAVVQKGTEPLVILLIAGVVFHQVQVVGRDVPEIVFLLFLLRRAITYALTAQLEYRKFIASSGSINVFRSLEQELRENEEDQKSDGVAPDFDKPIRLENVTFRYDDSGYALKGIDVVIPPKSTVAFVGASGAGKSTFVTLLTGVLRPTEGEILMGDTPYGSLNQGLLRSGIGYVTQESVIFSDTIRNNITLWTNGSSHEKVRSAARNAHIDQFIEQLPEGYDSKLGTNGINISGGQRQRINIARELFKDVRLLILDEATSSLDTDAEREIQQNIDEFRGEKTIVLIAHRLSTVRNSDFIFVINDGAIIERGTYEELYSLAGEFRRIVDQQTTEMRETEGQPTSSNGGADTQGDR